MKELHVHIEIFTPLLTRSASELQETKDSFVGPLLRALEIPPVSVPDKWESCLFRYSPRSVFGTHMDRRYRFGAYLDFHCQCDSPEQAQLFALTLTGIVDIFQHARPGLFCTCKTSS